MKYEKSEKNTWAGIANYCCVLLFEHIKIDGNYAWAEVSERKQTTWTCNTLSEKCKWMRTHFGKCMCVCADACTVYLCVHIRNSTIQIHLIIPQFSLYVLQIVSATSKINACDIGNRFDANDTWEQQHIKTESTVLSSIGFGQLEGRRYKGRITNKRMRENKIKLQSITNKCR